MSDTYFDKQKSQSCTRHGGVTRQFTWCQTDSRAGTPHVCRPARALGTVQVYSSVASLCQYTLTTTARWGYQISC